MKYYTYRKQVPLKPGETVGFTRHRGYHAVAHSIGPIVRDISRAQYVLFAAQEPLNALAAPGKYAVALSADHAFRYDNLGNIIQELRDHGHRVPGWCDCLPEGIGTPAEVGAQFVKDYGLDYFIGQAESADEFDAAMAAGATVVVGNITALLDRQITLAITQNILFIQEDYWNEGWGRAQHPLIAAHCNGIYPTNLWNPQIQTYKNAGRWDLGDGLFEVATVEDWQNLP
jgi:hypothetical protein